MNILGITLFTHDSSATLIKGEKIVGCCEEERFSREKHTNNFPVNSINFLLDEGKIKANEIDQIVIPYEPMKNYFSKIYFSIFNNKSVSSTLKSLYSNLFLFLNFKKRIKKLFNSFNLNLSDKCEINTFEHHLAHAASSFYVSGFKDAVIITWDGRGEWVMLDCFKSRKEQN